MRSTISPLSSRQRIHLLFMGAVTLIGCLLVCAVFFFFTHRNLVQKPASRIIQDMSGTSVRIPDHVGRIADAWPAHNEVVAMLGADRKVVATILSASKQPWLYKVAPGMNQAKTIFTPGNAVDTESLLQLRPDVLFAPTSDAHIRRLTDAGIPVIVLNFNNFDDLHRCFRLTAKVLGDQAPQRAETYLRDLDSRIALVQLRTSPLPASRRPRVLHIQGAAPLLVDGRDTIIDKWIRLAGGVNAADEISGNMKQVNVEQIIAWKPDVIILGSNAQNLAHTIETDPAWRSIPAVAQKRILINPVGAFPWDRYGAELSLQLLWAAQQLHPELFRDIDMPTEVSRFYSTYFSYHLDDQEINAILRGAPPASR